MARLWDQEGLLVVFQGLQANAKWWHILSSQGVKIDPRTFQSSDVVQRDASIRSVVAELLERSGMDLELAIDYCRQFDVEPEYASLVYIEKVMLLPPSGLFMSGTLATTANDALWARSVRRAAAGIEEKAVLSCLRGVLAKIHPLDYEKIRFACTWIVDALADEVEAEQDQARRRDTAAAAVVTENDTNNENDDSENSNHVNGNRGLGRGRSIQPFSSVQPTATAHPDSGLLDKNSNSDPNPLFEAGDEGQGLGRAQEETELCRKYCDVVSYLGGE